MTKGPLWTNDRFRLASVEITQRCNNICPYCDQTKAERDMPVAQFVALLDELISEDVGSVALGGGEPTLHPALPVLLDAACKRGLRAGLTTNARDPGQIMALADSGLLYSFGVSAGKGEWTVLAAHPRSVINLLLLRKGLKQVTEWAVQAILHKAVCLLLLGYKGARHEFAPRTEELSDALSLLTRLGQRSGVTVAADDYTRRRLGLAETCGEGFVRINLDGSRDICCFPYCEYRNLTMETGIR